MKRLILFGLLLLAACTSSDNEEGSTPAPPDPTPTATQAPALNVETRLALEGQYESLRQLHSGLDTLWGDLFEGRTAACSTAFTPVAPESLPLSDDPLIQALRSAAIELQSALNIWLSECQNPRENVPQDVIQDALLMVRAAGDALNEAETLLSQ